MKARKSKQPKDTIRGVRIPLTVYTRMTKAAKKAGLTRNGFVVQAMREKADAVLGMAA